METFGYMLQMQAGMHEGSYYTVRHFCPFFSRMSNAKEFQWNSPK